MFIVHSAQEEMAVRSQRDVFFYEIQLHKVASENAEALLPAWLVSAPLLKKTDDGLMKSHALSSLLCPPPLP